MRKGDFPTRDNCDPTNPEEAFLWMFAALPHVKGAPLIMPVAYYRQISKRLWDLGARPSEEPTLEWVPPTATEPHWLSSPGRWVPAGTSKAAHIDKAKSAVARMSQPQRAELAKALQSETLPDTEAGRAVKPLTPKQRDTVLAVLKGEL